MENKIKNGFTLMEVLVALTIFSVVVTIATDFFLSSSRTQKKTERMQEVSSGVRSIMERIILEVKENEVDYAYSDYLKDEDQKLALPQTVLALKDFEDKSIIFKKDGDAGHCPSEASTPCLSISTGGNLWSSLTGKGVRLKDLKFFITPAKDPFKFNVDSKKYEADEQPYVLILLSLETVGVRPEEYASLTLQTGISSRIYKR